MSPVKPNKTKKMGISLGVVRTPRPFSVKSTKLQRVGARGRSVQEDMNMPGPIIIQAATAPSTGIRRSKRTIRRPQNPIAKYLLTTASTSDKEDDEATTTTASRHRMKIRHRLNQNRKTIKLRKFTSQCVVHKDRTLRRPKFVNKGQKHAALSA